MVFSKYQEKCLLRIMSDHENIREQNFNEMKYSQPANILLNLLAETLGWYTTQLMRVILFAVYITPVF